MKQIKSLAGAPPALVIRYAIGVAIAFAWPFAASAQGSVRPAETAASAPPLAKPALRLQSPAEKRESASTPGDLRPEQPVTPQISLPIGRTPPSQNEPRPNRPGRANQPTGGSIDDRVARCEAQSSASAQAQCRRNGESIKP